jgi:large subunit ribosomal protein L33
VWSYFTQAARLTQPSFFEDTEMASKKGNRIIITLACTECRERNYTSEKNRKNDQGRLELQKYCPRCRNHRLHRETK